MHTDKGEKITQKTYDSKVILIIGDWNELESTSNDLETKIKSKTLELYRRDSRNIEILTYDELYERARFIVEGDKNHEIESDTNTESEENFDFEDDDLPF